jgi:hypothetical protein
MDRWIGAVRARRDLLPTIAALIVAFPFSAMAVDPVGNPYQGFYFGTTSGQCESGQFAVAVRADRTAIVFNYDSFDELGGVTTDVTIEADGTFQILDIDGDGTNVEGTISGSSISGTINEIGCSEGNFTGSRASCEDLADVSGFYTGTMSGSLTVTGEGVDTGVSGDYSLLVAADGQTFGYGDVLSSVFMASADDGGFLSTSSNGVVSGTFLGDTVISGNLNLGSLTGSGTANFSGDLGGSPAEDFLDLTWGVSQMEAIACPEPGQGALATTALVTLAFLRRRKKGSGLPSNGSGHPLGSHDTA